ncbi:GntR family transcriptional regulator [Streptacidiphilus rugosus]|uniref:GntR family transcriptional regulator n=1 Tax=Streptacidiphilus rugosus TaxID=405783 RepID=UPI000567CB63|nr:GntR family transcriptional regulator [Streptacidiphilus rugosus]
MVDGASASADAPYLRVAAAMRQRITDGTWPVGHRLPARATLGHEFGDVGENVIRRAQELLIAQGLLEGRAGSGTYVRAPRQRRRMLRSWAREQHATSPFRSEMASLGMAGDWEANSAAKTPALAHIAARLGIAEGDLCVRTDYEFFADRQPVMLSTSWEPMAITSGTVVVLPEGGPLAGAGVVARMAHIGVTVVRAVEVPRPTRLNKDQAELLGVAAGTQATLIERIYYDDAGSPVETADILVPDDGWEIAYEIQLSSSPVL